MDSQDIRLSNIPGMNVGRIVDVLSEAYCSLIKNDQPIAMMPSVMLWGPPGVGKSQGVRQIAARIESATGKRTHVTDVRLLLFNPIDLRGIPTANEDKTLAVWLKPQIFQMDESEDVVNILFLDEISAAPQTVQAAAYQITLDRVVGEHKLPDNCIVIAAGNRTTDKSVAYKMPKALANRLMHFDVIVDFEAWKKWGINKDINPKVVGFLNFKQDALMQFDSSTTNLAFPTPRSWEMVSNILNYVDENVENVRMLIAGLVGTEIMQEFMTWLSVYRDLPSVEDIFAGKASIVPKGHDKLYALISAMVSYAKKNKDNLNQIGNSITYAMRFPPDFSVVLIKDYLSIAPEYRKTLMKVPEFVRYMDKNGSLLNGSN